MRLHRLERPEPWPDDIRAAMCACPPSNLYPDYGAFHARLAHFAGVRPGQLVIGAGIEGLIRDLFILCCGRGDAVAYTWPTCGMFDVYAAAFGARAVRIVTPPEGVGADLVAGSVAGARLVILPNPGQPVDVCLGLDDLRMIARRCDGVLAIDEAYFGFGAPTAVALADEFPNVVVLRTFSKAAGGAALRVGFAVAAPDIARSLDAIRMSGEVPGPSLHAASVLMDNWHVVEAGTAEVAAGRDWLRDRLRADGFTARGEWANHVLVRVVDAAGIAAKLSARGVYVRVNAAPLDEWLMVTCGSRELMERFHARFREVV